jgi:hypothetical protein
LMLCPTGVQPRVMAYLGMATPLQKRRLLGKHAAAVRVCQCCSCFIVSNASDGLTYSRVYRHPGTCTSNEGLSLGFAE